MTAPTETVGGDAPDIADRLGTAFELEQESAAQEQATEEPEAPEEAPESVEAEPEEDAPEEPDPSTVDSVDPAQEKAEAESEKAEAETEEPEETEVEVEAASEEDAEIQTIDDLAAAFEVEPDQLTKHLQVQLGEESIPLSEVIERANQAPPAAQMAQLLTQQNEQLTQAEATRQQTFEENNAVFLGAVNALVTDAEERAGFSEAALAHLRQTDPETWAVRNEERREFYAKIDQNIKNAKEYAAKNGERANEAYQQRAIEEGLKLVQAIPEWQDQNLATWEATLIARSIQDRYGFSAEEMAQMPDHRLALAFRDAHRYHKLLEGAVKTKQTLTKKKLSARKTVVPTRPRRAKSDPNAQARAAARKRLRESAGDVSRKGQHEADAAELMGDHL